MIVGVDPSLRCTGLAVATRSGDVKVTRFPTVAVRSLEEQVVQTRYIVGSLLKAVPQEIDLTVIEAPYVPRHGAGDVVERAWLFGLLVDQLSRRGPVAVMSPMGRAKVATGNGNADKATVLAAVAEAFPDVALRDHNEGDGLALAWAGLARMGFVCPPMTKQQQDAMAKVAWPETKEQ